MSALGFDFVVLAAYFINFTILLLIMGVGIFGFFRLIHQAKKTDLPKVTSSTSSLDKIQHSQADTVIISPMARLLVGLGTATLVLLWGFVAVSMPLVGIVFSYAQADTMHTMYPIWFNVIMVLNGFRWLLNIVLFIFYIWHVSKNQQLSTRDSIWVSVALFILPFITMPIYFYRHLR